MPWHTDKSPEEGSLPSMGAALQISLLQQEFPLQEGSHTVCNCMLSESQCYLRMPSVAHFYFVGSNLRNLSELATTDTDEKDMAAPAITGDNNPKAAIGIPMML